MKYKSLFVLIGLFVANAHATGVEELKPIRYAKLRYQISQIQWSYLVQGNVNKVGTGNAVCHGEIDAPVYNIPVTLDSGYTFQNAAISCDGQTAQGPVRVQALADVQIEQIKFMADQAPVMLKEFSLEFYVTKNNGGSQTELVSTPLATYSKDLSVRDLNLRANSDSITTTNDTGKFTDTFVITAELTDEHQ